jgi:hypothetical protein
MASFETIGGGSIAADGRNIIRKVVISTSGSVSAPPGPGGYQLTNKTITQEAGGIERGVFEYTSAQRAGTGGDPNFDAYGKRFELMGGTREVPTATHSRFKDLTSEQVAAVETAVEDKSTPTFDEPDQQLLFNLLSKGVEYILAPSVVGRVTEIESSLPSMEGIAKAGGAPGLSAPSGTFWVCTGISASPIGDKFQVSREYTLNFADPALVDVYNW